jgi:uncharacterized sporulation protein YeaH/YhbH (DUF444 family)
MKECERGEDEENLSEEGVAHYKEVEKDGADDGGVNYSEDFFIEEVHMTETHCFKEVALPDMHQHPTEEVIEALIEFAEGNVPVQVQAKPAATTASAHVTYEELMSKSDKRMFEHQQQTLHLLQAPATMKKDKDLSLASSVRVRHGVVVGCIGHKR